MISRETMGAFSNELQKIAKASAASKNRPDDSEDEGIGFKTVGRTIASNALGLSAGIAAGYGAGKLIEIGARKAGVPLKGVHPKVLKGATTAMGIALPIWRAAEQRAMSGRKHKK